MFKREKTYKVGKNQHDGLVTEIRYGSLPESQDGQQDISKEEKAMLLNQYQEFLDRKEQQSIGLDLPEQSEQWDLKQLIPNLAKQYFSSYLAGLGLPSEFDQHYLRGKSGMTAFSRFKRLVGLRANKANLPDKELISVDIALSGLEKLSQAQINAAAGRYQQAAIFIGQAMPGAVILQTMVMERPWRIGKERFRINASDKVSGAARKPEINEIIEELAKMPGKAKELWPTFFGVLDCEGFSPVQSASELKYSYTDHKGREDKMKFSTFQNKLSQARKFLK